MPKSAKRLEKVGSKFRPGLKKGGPKCENRTPVKVLARFSTFPNTPKNMPNRSQMEPNISKIEKTRRLRSPKKLVNADCQKVGKSVTTRQSGVS